MAFFKYEDENLLHAEDLVSHRDYILRASLRETYTYPKDGWYWFETKKEAMAFFSRPETVDVVSMAQARQYLFDHGLTQAVADFLETLPEPQRSKAKIDYEYRGTVERNHPLVTMVAQLFQWDADQVNTFFKEASLL